MDTFQPDDMHELMAFCHSCKIQVPTGIVLSPMVQWLNFEGEKVICPGCGNTLKLAHTQLGQPGFFRSNPQPGEAEAFLMKVRILIRDLSILTNDSTKEDVENIIRKDTHSWLYGFVLALKKPDLLIPILAAVILFIVERFTDNDEETGETLKRIEGVLREISLREGQLDNIGKEELATIHRLVEQQVSSQPSAAPRNETRPTTRKGSKWRRNRRGK